MSVKLETYNGSDKHNLAIAHAGVWSIESESMLAIDRNKIQGFSCSILAFEEGTYDPPLGHIGMAISKEGEAEIRSFVVNPAKRGRGIGSTLLRHLLESVAEKFEGINGCIANVNDDSLGIFLAQGGVLIGSRVPESPTGCNNVVDMMPALDRMVTMTPALEVKA